MITQGMAWWYRAYAREQSPQERRQYEFAEEEAAARSIRLIVTNAYVLEDPRA